ncbi:hypothetical protein CAL29_30060 [Bordetella genomosp. 10]|uniref:ABC transporter substrate-binding protein n=1 Tax=Bordetella genomosp. 10 TaxID=1416804 RepID=A0A261S539_9BORD|nr:tripartite tricarboxylate transporter substrate binding protein [Bordetella genomosp. 10]OZI32082.1 hypothetical protein CAL29_30060 [Bordetella genomosp. 10]
MAYLRLLFLLSSMAISQLVAAQAYPDKPVTLVIAFPPGASNDTVGRYLAQGLGSLWKQSVIVENRVGAGSAIGTAYVAKAKPDGYTLLLTSSAYTTLPAIMPQLSYSPEKDMTPVAMIGLSPLVLAVGPRVKAGNLREFIAEARARPVFFGTAGLGSATHFGGELINSAAGIDMKAVHYKGGGQVMVDMLGGRIDAFIATYSAVEPQLGDAKIRILAVMDKDRIDALPQVPTAAEQGLTGAESALWWGVFAPRGTPQPVIDKVNADIKAVMSKPEASRFLARQGGFARFLPPAVFADLVSREIHDWKALAQARGIKGQ